jgi:prepilin-type N-terminal cleavage/methylation domain-containing protein
MSRPGAHAARAVRGRRDGGFTLLEVLVATALAVGLVALLAQVADGVRRAQGVALDAWTGGAGVMLDAQAVAGLLRDALPAPPDQPQGGLVGRRHEVRFRAASQQAWRGSGTVDVVMRIEDEPGRGVRVVVQIKDAGRPGGEAPTRHVLLSGLRSASFEYVDASVGARPEWADASRLPGLVRLNLEHARTGAGPIAIAAAPRRQRVPGCVLDLVSVECRRDG